MFEREFATYNMLVSGLTDIILGVQPTDNVLSILFVIPSIIEMVLSPEFATYTMLVFGVDRK